MLYAQVTSTHNEELANPDDWRSLTRYFDVATVTDAGGVVVAEVFFVTGADPRAAVCAAGFDRVVWTAAPNPSRF